MEIAKMEQYNISNYCFYSNIKSEIKFVFVSDLHESPTNNLLNNIRNLNPDLILLGGDIIHNKRLFKTG